MDRRRFVGTACAGAVGALGVTLAGLAVPDVAHGAAPRGAAPLIDTPLANAGAAGVAPVFSRAPLAKVPYASLPPGAVRPAGWLHEQLRIMADGMTGHLDEVYPNVGKDNGWLGGDGDSWERGPYWLDGLVPLAHILGDEKLIAKAKPWIEHTLTTQRADGYFGPEDRPNGTDAGGVQRGNEGDWWPRMVMLKVLQSHYEATGDARVIPFMTRYFHYQLATLPAKPLAHWTYWAKSRGGENLASIYWLYDRTGDAALLELAKTIAEQTSDWTGGFLHRQPPSIHGVNVAMGVKQPAVAYLQTHDPKQLQAVERGLAYLREEHGQVQGMFSGDEPLHGTNPIQGTELCTVVELMFSLETLVRITGRVDYADHLERVAYNALPAQVADDYWTRQYYQQPNQVVVRKGGEQFVQQQEGTASLVGLVTGYPCCTVNMHQGWPKFVQQLWLASADGGIAAMTYGPCAVTMQLGGATVSIEEATEYPFDETIRFTVRTSRVAEFPLHLRVPGWANGATLRVNGVAATSPAAGKVAVLRRAWRDGDVVELRLPAVVKRNTWHSDLAGIERGPLVYALRMEEEWRKTGEQFGTPIYEVHSTSAWNYGLAADAIEIEKTGAVPSKPWRPEAAPIRLVARARKIPGWDANYGVYGMLPYSPAQSSEPVEKIVLVPYGCTTLRISEFPKLA
ncbi:MAG TPA: beta-L-arabinofuranosidase domain-containing protein [Gemmatimonadaceae bacterium]|nr:beta-L-arabinofuranosidase domain-containing protein [Gemmatimonadaceae bacterium]